MIVYLSGSIAGLTYDEANEWRQRVTDAFSRVGIETANPLRRRMFFSTNDEETGSPNEVVQRDISDLRRCDLTIINWTGPSIGTICELWECYRTGKPVILVTSDPAVITHPWIRVAVTRIFPDLESAIKHICVRWADIDPEGLPEMWT